MEDGRRILIIKLGALGDFFLAQPAIAAIRRHHAGDHLSLLTLPSLAPMARMSGLFDAVLEDPRGRSLQAYLSVRHLLRAGRFDRIYDLQCQSRTDRYFWLMLPGRRPEWSGTARGASHPDRYPGRRRLPVQERYARQLQPFGITPDPTAELSWLTADTDAFRLSAPYALLVPGSSPGGQRKRWPSERYGELACLLAQRGITPVVLGSRDEADLGGVIHAACPHTLDLTGRTSIPEVAALGRKAWACVGNDTGPVHLIAALGCPTLLLLSAASLSQASGPRVRVHFTPDLADMSVAGVIEALDSLHGLTPAEGRTGPARLIPDGGAQGFPVAPP
jgi:ADP-heptose:LPS heptosyltransferase